MSSIPTSVPAWLRIEACQGAWAEGSMYRCFTCAAGWSLSADVRTCLDIGDRAVGAGLKASRDRESQAGVVRGGPWRSSRRSYALVRFALARKE
jgi:hypothetical protein